MPDSSLTRRDLLKLAGTGLAAFTAACAAPLHQEAAWMPGKRERKEPSPRGRLTARPSVPSKPPPAGLEPLAFGQERDGFLYVPSTYHPDRPAPLVVMFHGASGRGRRALARLQAAAEEANLILLAPDSRGYTWDVVMDDFGPDVEFVDRALSWAFERCAVDPAMIATEGFSDGASYAISLGLTNGDLFTHAIAFSPGFLVPAELHGSPRVFVSHGTQDQILPIDRCSRRIVPRLKDRGYHVRYVEFDGSHEVPAHITREAVNWLLPLSYPRRSR
jgi:phospholipase/carboxylesterase